MGEEEKKPEEKKPEEEKKEEVPKPSGDEKKEEKKAEEATPEPPPPPPPPEIVLRVFMHCEGCARKVRKSLKGFQGVEDVITDCKTHKVVVKGEKADPLKVLERVQKKSHRQVELLSPIPKPPPAEEPNKSEEKEVAKPQEKKEEPQVITVVLKVHMHCEACAQEIKRRIQKMKGVENAEPDLKNSQVTVKGVFEASKLVDYVSKRSGKRAEIVKVEPEKKEEKKPKEEAKEEKKTEKEAKKVEEEESKEKKEQGGEAAAKEETVAPAAKEETVEQVNPKVEVKKNEFYYYHHPQNFQMHPQRFAHEMHAYPPPPQIFSDENPNACSVM
ncbi:PREDICTED: heavy metal-associated isoprenylated plant protein 7-like [Nicotiana attenuata]|uniref:Heavy metal-associated isoprenylated plant protein 3 n=1 Tax=Nicotiana attenuata TaxID=49451 RepID=A0A314KYQ7_NICAT|nr:PREDICTED: heavy metal-associated isoprenylated plant protein 7-like [Nicotiana attenuata]OIT34372.1 heavy metal-associated isoprenylated plant protein 3 [Nicotiana attenuata]